VGLNAHKLINEVLTLEESSSMAQLPMPRGSLVLRSPDMGGRQKNCKYKYKGDVRSEDN
jgi:hypothetical protein